MRMAFTIAMRATPTSAKTASQSVAIPPAPRMRTSSFTPKASEMFCQTIRRVCLPARMAVATLEGWSVCITTSAVSMAASLPSPPMTKGKNRGIIDAVAHKGYPVGRVAAECFDVLHLSVRQQVSVCLGDAQLFCKVSNNGLFVSR